MIALNIYKDQAAYPVDLKEGDNGISLSFFVNNIANIIEAKSSFVQGVTLIGTKRTNAALEYIFRLDKLDDATSIIGTQIEATLEIDGIDVLKGKAILEIEFVNIGINPDTTLIEYECNIIAGRYNWASRFQSMYACDLDLGTHTYDEATVLNSQDRTGALGGVYDENYIGCAYYPVHYGTWRMSTNYVSFWDLRPHTYICHLFTTAFAALGYTLIGDYIESEDYRQLSMLFTRGNFVADLIEANQAQTQAYHDVGLCYSASSLTFGDIVTLAAGGSDNWSGTKWTQPPSFGLNMEINFTVDPGLTTTDVAFAIVKFDGVETILEVEDYVFLTGNTITHRTCLEPGEQIYIRVVYNSVNNPTIAPGSFPPGANPCPGAPSPQDQPYIIISFIEASLDIRPAFVVDELQQDMVDRCYGTTVALCKTIDPSLTIKSIIDGVSHAEGLIWVTDETKKEVTVYNSSQFFSSKDTLDWSGKLDHSQLVKRQLRGEKCLNTVLRYKSDSADKLAGYYDQKYYSGQGLFSARAVDDSNDPCEEVYENPTFSPTYSVGADKLFPNKDQTEVPPFTTIWLSLWKNDWQAAFDANRDISYNFQPRLVRYSGLLDETDIGWQQSAVQWVYADHLDVTSTKAYIPYAYTVDWYQLTRKSLAYDSNTRPTISPNLGGGPAVQSLGILDSEYSFLYNIIRNGDIFEAWIYLSVTDINQLDFSRPIKIDVGNAGSGIFYLSEIRDWSPETRLCKCVFLQLKDGYIG